VKPVAETTWLLTIARNVCLTRIDVQNRRARIEFPEDPHVLAASAGAEPELEATPAVSEAIALLPERQRLALYLREWQQLSYSEIATALGTSEAAVETLLFRARESLAVQLGAPRRHRRGLDLAGLLGWLRSLSGAGLPKLAAGVTAVVAVGAAGVATHEVGHTPPAARHAHAPAPARVHAPAAGVPRAETHRTTVHSRAVASPPPSPSAASGHSPASQPVATPEPAQPVARQPAPVTPRGTLAAVDPAGRGQPAPAPTVTSLVTAAAPQATVASAVDAVVQGATDATVSTVDATVKTVDAVQATAAAAPPAAAPTADAVAQTLTDATSTVSSTVSHLLGKP
jgi:hypothetical protein